MKPDDHGIITVKAMELFAKHWSGETAEYFADHSKEIIQGSILEDTKPLWRRLTNWHFHKANELMRPKRAWYLLFAKVRPTSEWVLAKLIDDFRRAAQAPSLSPEDMVTAGRILHHVQDMSTPSHVTPVYHGLIVQDEFERWSRDEIKRLAGEIKAEDKDVAAIIAEGHKDPMGVYDQAARDTRAILGDQGKRFDYRLDGQARQGGWELFWIGHGDPDGSSSAGSRRLSRRGFGRFGPLGEVFGGKSRAAKESPYQAEPTVYEKIYLLMMNKMLADSLRALAALEAVCSSSVASAHKPNG